MQFRLRVHLNGDCTTSAKTDSGGIVAQSATDRKPFQLPKLEGSEWNLGLGAIIPDRDGAGLQIFSAVPRGSKPYDPSLGSYLARVDQNSSSNSSNQTEDQGAL